MASILRPFSSILAPGKFQIPNGPMTIDWGHSLSQGLIAYVLPGIAFIDLAQPANTSKVLNYAGTFKGSITQDGPALDATANDAADDIETSLTVPNLSSTQQSIYWRGYINGDNPSSSAVLCGTTFSSPNSSPFVNFWIQYVGTRALRLGWNDSGGLSANVFVSGLSSSTFYGIGGTIKNGGNVVGYINGVQDFSNGPINYSGATGGYLFGPTNANVLINLLCIWNRELTAAEMAWIHSDPYGMLVPAEYDLPILSAAQAAQQILMAQAML